MKTRTYSHALGLLNGQARRKLAPNTYAEQRDNGDIAVKLYDTDVLTFHADGQVTVNSGAFKTKTTKDRINAFLPPGFPRVYQSRKLWFIGSKPFVDGCVLGARGAIHSTEYARRLLAAK